MLTTSELIKKMAGVQPQLCSGKITAVDSQKGTCSFAPDGGVAPWQEVWLQHLGSDRSHSLMLPVEGSTGIATLLPGGIAALLTASAYARVLWLHEDMEIELNGDQLKINGGDNGGLVLVAALKRELDDLKNSLNRLAADYMAHFHTHPQGPTGPVAVAYTHQNLPPTDQQKMENKKILH